VKLSSGRHTGVVRPVLRVRQAFSAGVNFGVVDFDLTAEDPTVRFELRDEGGQAARRPGPRSWFAHRS